VATAKGTHPRRPHMTCGGGVQLGVENLTSDHGGNHGGQEPLLGGSRSRWPPATQKGQPLSPEPQGGPIFTSSFF
jgi:hypothetical protein